jgi:hypothetical protein
MAPATNCYCNSTDLEVALGGASILVQLADDGSGTAVAATVTDYLESGAALIRSAIEVKYEPEAIAALDANSLRLLRDCNKWLSARIAWLEGGRGQAVPDRVNEQAERVQTMVDELRTGERRLGRISGQTPTAIGQPVGVINPDPLACKVSIAGFRRGFR